MKTVNPNLNRNVKKILSLLLLGCMLLPSFSSCHRKRVDPFKTTPSSEASESMESFKDEEDPFYSMTGAESAQKYGTVSYYFDLSAFDGKYIYRYGFLDDYDYPVLYKSPVENLEMKWTVCTDPLCTHSGGNCPLENIYCFDFCGKTLFYTNSKKVTNSVDKLTRCELCMYDAENNKKIVLDSIEGGGEEEMYLQNMFGTLYYAKRIEKSGGFEYNETWYKLDENGVMTELATVGKHFGTFTRYFYNDQTFIYVSHLKDDGSHYYKEDEETVYRLGLYNVGTGEEQLVHSFKNGYDDKGKRVSYDLFCWGFYGNNVLYEVEINTDGIRTCKFYLLNLDTMEDELLFEDREYDTVHCFTDYCIMYSESQKMTR